MEFTITRIQTPIGIFRLKGLMPETAVLSFSHAEFMGSDGWVEIDLESDGGRSILSRVEADIILHLRS
ncbi:hypothetical protein J8Z24_19705 [Pseudoalteromonas sp. SCSIO 43201]|uniref:hypothetical protein n=1 Tax=Pseudoalteromonas sp. SCSIO 43201 TaxID=2822842 RepID=UPI002075FD0E|nr:hypothetical protein [Pseudoalteromonas sp. SCSIO 43201]USD30361.1 hypothetical protein J8Z24_19705 [Pseudoalteromonas sp. SCSIO 43201]